MRASEKLVSEVLVLLICFFGTGRQKNDIQADSILQISDQRRVLKNSFSQKHFAFFSKIA
jgi:hypothetical protein|tara:strand:- start:258 stop:437 length:180 start_codon:yes stop_codon:yes gene_type:complete